MTTAILAAVILALLMVIAIQRERIQRLQNDVAQLRTRDAQWSDPSAPRPLPIGES